jgi:hypothetical protein
MQLEMKKRYKIVFLDLIYLYPFIFYEWVEN